MSSHESSKDEKEDKAQASTPFSALNEKWKNREEKDPELPAYLTDESKEAVISRLRKIEGQVRALRRMVITNQPPNAIVQQIASISGALSGLSCEYINDYLKDDFLDSFPKSSDREKDLSVIRFLINKLIRS